MNPASQDSPTAQILDFPSLVGHTAWLAHGFTGRVPGVEITEDRAATLSRLEESHLAAVAALGFSPASLCRAEQVHGPGVAVVETGGGISPGVDALVTATPGLLLGIHVADCGPVWVVDPARRVIGLAHSGRKGTEGRITTATIECMASNFGSRPADLIVQLGPCIRPPWYEVDIATTIVQQAVDAGVPRAQVHDCGICTAAGVDQYYSYRREKGRTGRMLALLGIRK